MKHPHPTNLEPSYYINAIKQTPAFREVMSEQPEGELTPEKRRTRINTAIGRSAAFLTTEFTETSGYRHTEGDMFNLISRLDAYYNAQKQLDHFEELTDQGARVHRSEKLPHLRAAVEFNHALKEIIDNNPSVGFDQLVGFATRMYVGVNGPEHANYFNSSVRATLNGMRHEIGAEQIIGALGIEYDDATTEDDLNGADMIIHLNDVTFPIDIKASPGAALRAREKSRNPNSIIWSQLDNSDFGQGFRIPYETATAKSAAMQQALEVASQSAETRRVA